MAQGWAPPLVRDKHHIRCSVRVFLQQMLPSTLPAHKLSALASSTASEPAEESRAGG